MPALLYPSAFALLALLAVVSIHPTGTMAIVTCQNCSTFRVKCVSTSFCCNDHQQNGACTPNGQTCPPAVLCSQDYCGLDCNGNRVYCPVGQDCCNGCQGQNICVNPGGSCTQEFPPCGS